MTSSALKPIGLTTCFFDKVSCFSLADDFDVVVVVVVVEVAVAAMAGALFSSSRLSCWFLLFLAWAQRCVVVLVSFLPRVHLLPWGFFLLVIAFVDFASTVVGGSEDNSLLGLFVEMGGF